MEQSMDTVSNYGINTVSDNMTIDELVKRGITLMKSALEKYEKGLLDWGNHDRMEANHLFNILHTKLSNTGGRDTMMYGECRNFGILYQVFENSASDLIKNNRKGFKEIVKLIKENKVLNDEFKIYNAIVHPTNVGSAKDYVEEAVSLIKHYPAEKLFENNEILLNKIKKHNLYEMIQIDDDLMNIYEDIEFMIMNKKKYSNLSNYAKIKNRLQEFVERNGKEDKKLSESKTAKSLIEDVSNSNINEEIMSKLEDKLCLNDDEKAFVKTLSENIEKGKTIFEEQKNKTIKAINDVITEGDSKDNEEWKNVLEQITNKDFDEKNYISTIAELVEIENVLLNK